MASALGLTFQEKNGSAFREFQILGPCSKQAFLELERTIQSFNDSLPPDCLNSVHGIRLVAPARTRLFQGVFFTTPGFSEVLLEANGAAFEER